MGPHASGRAGACEPNRGARGAECGDIRATVKVRRGHILPRRKSLDCRIQTTDNDSKG